MNFFETTSASKWLWTISSALLLTLGFAPWNQAWAGWIALVPMALYLRLADISYQETARHGWVFGFLHFLSTFYWITYVSWAGWLILAVYLALYPMLWCAFWRWLIFKQNRVFRDTISPTQNLASALFGSSAWVMLEWLRSWVLTGFSWNMLGVTQVKITSIIQIADLGGVYLVSWLVAFVSLLFSGMMAHMILNIKSKPPSLSSISFFRLRIDLFAALFLILAATVYGGLKLSELPIAHASLKYLAIQPDIPQKPWERPPVEQSLQKLKKLTEEGLVDMQKKRKGTMHPRGGIDDGMPDLILWPEAPLSISPTEHEIYRPLLSSLLQQKPYAMLVGGIEEVENAYYNVMALVWNSAMNYQIYSKRHLVIFGEYVPLASWFPWLRALVPVPVDLSSGKEPGMLMLENKSITLAPLLCFEDTCMSVVRDAAKLNPDLWISPANNAWFGTSAAAWQHLNNAIFRCVEYRKPMLRVTNNGITAAINEKGEIKAILSSRWRNSSNALLEPSADNSMVYTVDESAKNIGRSAGWMCGIIYIHPYEPTFYARFGEWVPKLCSLLLFFFFFLSLRQKNLHNS